MDAAYSGGMRAVLLLPILLVAASSDAQKSPARQDLMTQVLALKPDQRTDKARATLLARAYFRRHLGGCGGASRPIDRGTRWLFTTQVGYEGSPGPDIFVDKRTGTTSSKGRPTVKDPSAYYRKLKNEGQNSLAPRPSGGEGFP